MRLIETIDILLEQFSKERHLKRALYHKNEAERHINKLEKADPKDHAKIANRIDYHMRMWDEHDREGSKK